MIFMEATDNLNMEAWMKSVSLQMNAIQSILERIRNEHLIVCPNTLLDVVDVSNILKMTPKAVYKWAYANKIKSIKIGGRRMFFVKDLLNPAELMR